MSSTASKPLQQTAARTHMHAATVVAPERVELHQVPMPEPGDGEVRIRLEGCGVCASNVPPFEGRPWFEYPFAPGALGHEGWGHVDALGKGVRRIREGDRVAFISDNAFAEYECVNADALVPLPPALDERAVPGEPLGCAINIARRAQLRPGQTVAIVGTGFLGCLLAQLANAAGARVIAVGRRSCSLQQARRLGAEKTIALDDSARVIEQVREQTSDALCDVVIECTGKAHPLELAAELTRVRGRLVVAGFHQDGARQVNMQLWNWRGLDVINAHERDPAVYQAGIREAINAVVAGRLTPEPLFTHTYRLGQLGDALRATRDRPAGFMKALIDMRR